MAGLACGISFVGRTMELGELLGRLEAARHGEGSVALAAGEPGIGKTRLVLELAERAQSQGTCVFFGRAYESDGMPPTSGSSEAMRPYVSACPLEQLQEQLGDGTPEVALVVREVRAHPHSQPSETVYIRQGGKVRIHLADGSAVEADLPDGPVMWHEPWTHRIENVGSSDILAVIVENKRGGGLA